MHKVSRTDFVHHILASTKFCVLPTEKCLYFKQCKSVREIFVYYTTTFYFQAFVSKVSKTDKKVHKVSRIDPVHHIFSIILSQRFFFRERSFIKNVSFGGARKNIISKLVNNPFKDVDLYICEVRFENCCFPATLFFKFLDCIYDKFIRIKVL